MGKIPRADYEDFIGQSLISIKGYKRSVWQNKTISYKEILLEFDKISLLLSVSQDTDEIATQRIEGMSHENWVDISELKIFWGEKTDRSWIGHSDIGYSDLFIMSLSKNGPMIVFYAMSSNISIYTTRVIKSQ